VAEVQGYLDAGYRRIAQDPAGLDLEPTRVIRSLSATCRCRSTPTGFPTSIDHLCGLRVRLLLS
jgi:hypothetical protein